MFEEELGNKEVNNELKEKVLVNFDMKKVDVILVIVGVSEVDIDDIFLVDEIIFIFFIDIISE